MEELASAIDNSREVDKVVRQEVVPSKVDHRFPRASTLYDACMRQYVISNGLNIVHRDFIPPARQMTFDIGSCIHEFLQNKDRYFGQNRRGTWECMACGMTTDFGPPPSKPCKCGARIESFKYKELMIKLDNPIYVSGHPDMFIELNGCNRLVEIKSISGEKFRSLNAPLVQHTWQVLTYAFVCKTTKLVPAFDESESYVVYVSKQEIRDELPMKPFTVKYDELLLREIIAKLLVFKCGIERRVLPEPAIECIETKFQGQVARRCHVWDACVNAYRRNSTWLE